MRKFCAVARRGEEMKGLLDDVESKQTESQDEEARDVTPAKFHHHTRISAPTPEDCDTIFECNGGVFAPGS